MIWELYARPMVYKLQCVSESPGNLGRIQITRFHAPDIWFSRAGLMLFGHELCPTLWDPVDCSMPGFLVLHCLPEFVHIHVHWVSDLSNHLILCHTLLLLPSMFPSIRVFSSELALHIRWSKSWNLSFSSRVGIKPRLFNRFPGDAAIFLPGDHTFRTTVLD